MDLGSGKPLAVKLGIKAGMRMAVLFPPDGYAALLGPLPEGASIEAGQPGKLDLVHLFVRERATLDGLLREVRARIVPSGMIWVSWPKRSSGVPTDLTEGGVREAALAAGLVDVKVCSVDETWSGLKLVIRVRDR